MEFVKEYAAGADFPSELSYSCFFWTEYEFYGIVAQRKQLYRCSTGNTAVVCLFREYIKIVANPEGTDFFAYTQFPNCNEVSIYHLDCHFKELDCLKVKKIGGNFPVVDLWFDGVQEFLFLVYPKAILKYNCNGDYLGIFMSATTETVYCSMCTFENLLFLAYKRNNCPHVGLYRSDGSFKEKISLGWEYQFLGMQVITEKKGSFLMLHVMKKGEIPLFCELNFHSIDIPQENPATSPCPVTSPCPADKGKWKTGEEIEVEIVLEDDIGEATCHIEPQCHTFRPVT